MKYKWSYNERIGLLTVEGNMAVSFKFYANGDSFQLFIPAELDPGYNPTLRGFYYNGTKIDGIVSPPRTEWKGMKFYISDIEFGRLPREFYSPLEYGRLIQTKDFTEFFLMNSKLPPELYEPEYIKTLARGVIDRRDGKYYVIAVSNDTVKMITINGTKVEGIVLPLQLLKDFLDGKSVELKSFDVIDFGEAPRRVEYDQYVIRVIFYFDNNVKIEYDPYNGVFLYKGMMYHPIFNPPKPSKLSEMNNLVTAGDVIVEKELLKDPELPAKGFVTREKISSNFVAPPERLIKYQSTRLYTDVFPWFREDSKKTFWFNSILFTVTGYVFPASYLDGLYLIRVPYDCESCDYVYYDRAADVPDEYIVNRVFPAPVVFSDYDSIIGFFGVDVDAFFKVSSGDRHLMISANLGNSTFEVSLIDGIEKISARFNDLSPLEMVDSFEKLKMVLSLV